MRKVIFNLVFIAVFGIMLSGFSCNGGHGSDRGTWNYAVDVYSGNLPLTGITVRLQKVHFDYSNPTGFGDVFEGFTDSRGRVIFNACPVDPNEDVQIIVYALGGPQTFYPVTWLPGNDEDIADYYARVDL